MGSGQESSQAPGLCPCMERSDRGNRSNGSPKLRGWVTDAREAASSGVATPWSVAELPRRHTVCVCGTVGRSSRSSTASGGRSSVWSGVWLETQDPEAEEGRKSGLWSTPPSSTQQPSRAFRRFTISDSKRSRWAREKASTGHIASQAGHCHRGRGLKLPPGHPRSRAGARARPLGGARVSALTTWMPFAGHTAQSHSPHPTPTLASWRWETEGPVGATLSCLRPLWAT